MRFDGEWLQCDDGIVRPILRAEVFADDGRWRAAEFLVDTGADCTVFSADLMASLGVHSTDDGGEIRGVGGIVSTAIVATQIRLTREDDTKVVLRGQFTGCYDINALDMSVLGRDVMQLFAVIVDRPANRVCLLGAGHSYSINSN
jgi:predicted aspartyl protease